MVLISADDGLNIHAMPPRRLVRRPCPRSGGARPARRGRPTAPLVDLQQAARFARAGEGLPSPRTTTASSPAAAAPLDLDHDRYFDIVSARSLPRRAHRRRRRATRAGVAGLNDWTTKPRRRAPNRLVLLLDIPSYDPLLAGAVRCARIGRRMIVGGTVGRRAPIFEEQVAAVVGRRRRSGCRCPRAPSRRRAQPEDEARLVAHAGLRRSGPDAGRRDAARHDLLGHPRAAAARRSS